MLAVFFGLAVFSGTIFIFTRGPSVGFEQISSALPQALILLMFIYFLKRGNPFAGIVFGLWCMWGFFGIISDPGESFVMIFTYMWGMLNVVGLMGVFRSFVRSKKKVSP